MRHRLSILTEDASLARHLSEPLSRAGYEIQVLSTAPKYWQRTASFMSNLVLVDLDSMGREAMLQCRRLRALSSAHLMGIAQPGSEEDLLAAFAAGLDEYLTKPVSAIELVARAESLLRRRRASSDDWASRLPVTRDVALDTERRVLFVRGRHVKLTPIEFSLLEYLVRNMGQVVPRSALLQQVWGDQPPTMGSLNLYIYYLRRKIEIDPRHPRHILTKWGVGYYLAEDVPQRQTVDDATSDSPALAHHASQPLV